MESNEEEILLQVPKDVGDKIRQGIVDLKLPAMILKKCGLFDDSKGIPGNKPNNIGSNDENKNNDNKSNDNNNSENKGNNDDSKDNKSERVNYKNKTPREFVLNVEGKDYNGSLIDLPCIIEIQKTYNKQLYFKTGNISQMMVVYDEDKKLNDIIEISEDVHMDKKDNYKCDTGITPPSQNIRTRWSIKRPVCVKPIIDKPEDTCKICHHMTV